jgi:hypothetical protein
MDIVFTAIYIVMDIVFTVIYMVHGYSFYSNIYGS